MKKPNIVLIGFMGSGKSSLGRWIAKNHDYELIDKIRENDEESEEVMFHKYQPVIRNLAYNCYQKFSSYGYDYDDFYQEAMISFHRALKSYDDN